MARQLQRSEKREREREIEVSVRLEQSYERISFGLINLLIHGTFTSALTKGFTDLDLSKFNFAIFEDVRLL